MAVITVSRQFGSLGDEIAAQVCEMLGYRFFDKNLMAEIATEAGLGQADINDFSEDRHEVQGFVDRLLGVPRGMTVVRLWEDSDGMRAPHVVELDKAEAVTLVQDTIHAAYKRGNVLVLGRGGQAVLKDKPDVLHVRIEAPLPTRIERVRTAQGLRWDAAEDLVMRRDKASADYLKRFYNIEPGDATLYHLVLNTGKCDIPAAAQLIVQAVTTLLPALQPA